MINKQIKKFVCGVMFMCAVMTAWMASTIADEEKTIAVIGDSVSTFNTDSGSNDRTYYYPYWSSGNGNNIKNESETWRNIVADSLGAKLSYIDAISGSEITMRSLSDTESMTYRIMTSPSNLADIVIFMGGINDIWQGRNIGCVDACGATLSHCNDYAPALRYCLRILKEKNPEAKIMYCLITFDNDETYDYLKYLSVAKAICDDEDVAFCPVSGMECVAWHPTVTGMKQIANQVKAAMAAANWFVNE